MERSQPDDWSLGRKGAVDQARHAERVRQALTGLLPGIIVDESIVAGGGSVVVRIPIRSLREHRLRFDPRQEVFVGQGSGPLEAGEVLDWGGHHAGQRPGQELLEAEVPVAEIAGLLFADLALPGLEPAQGLEDTRSWSLGSVRRGGPLASLDLRRSLRANLYRHAVAGSPAVGAWSQRDLRFRAPRPHPERRARAAVIAMRDISGSMGETKKKVVRTLFFWMGKFLRTRYEHVEPVYVAHHVEAREVDEHTFFALGESGGTRVSSAWELCLDLVRRRFAAPDWNIYAYHFSDGDNWGDQDNRRCQELISALLARARGVGYGEIAEAGYRSPLLAALEELAAPRLTLVSLHGPEDVWAALHAFFPRSAEPEPPAGGA